ncbi:MAG: hypothetical protein IJS86_03785, partial [Lachnospiraceae bacterium]|nr:hypothetical protein [Lachnospiraceae bacterium]
YVVIRYINGNADRCGYTPEDDAAVSLGEKKLVFSADVNENAPKIMFLLNANRRDVEYEFERLDPADGTVLYSTGRIPENYYYAYENGLYRIHIYATDGSGEERIYYTKPQGIDVQPPRMQEPLFLHTGEGKPDKNGVLRYGSGQIKVKGAYDIENELHPKPYMFDYPNGVWQESNMLDARKGDYLIAIRDRAGNVKTEQVSIHDIDTDPPVTTFEEEDEDAAVNGYKRSVSLKVNAEDDTNIPENYISLDGDDWLSGDTVEISENGIYDIYTRDVFDHVSQNSIEIGNIDREPPEFSCNMEHISRGGGFSSKEILHVTAYDEKAGVFGDAYSFDKGETWGSDKILVISENGTYTVCVRDALGNTSDVRTVRVTDIDNKRPKIINAVAERENTSGKFAASSRITVTASDEESGLSGEAFFFEAEGRWKSENTYKAKRNGVYHFRVRDRVGNVESSYYTVENIDPDAPECVVRGNPESLTMSKVRLKVDINDRISGIRDICMADARAGIKKLLKEYPCDSEGAGKSEDSLDVDITSNGEYIFYVTDMCGNERKESVTVTKIIKPKKPVKNGEPSDEEEKGTGGEGGSGKKPVKEKTEPQNETVVIGSENKKTEKKSSSQTGIVVRNSSVSEEKAEEDTKNEVSKNRVSRGGDDDAGIFEEKEDPFADGLTDAYEGSDFSTDVFESDEDEYLAENGPRELEMLPNPDEIETGEEKKPMGGVIAVTVVLMIAGLSALTVFLLSKKGLIDLSGILGNKGEE